MAATYLGCKK